MARPEDQSSAGAFLGKRLLCEVKSIGEVPPDRSDILAVKCRGIDHKRFAHWSVLFVSSPFFAKILKQRRTGAIELDVSAEIFDVILEFIYVKQLQFEPRHAVELHTAAQQFQMDDLAKEVERKLANEDKYRSLRELFGRILSNGSGGDAVSATGSGAASDATPCRSTTNESPDQCVLYAVEWGGNQSTATFRNVDDLCEVTHNVKKSLSTLRAVVIRRNELFVAVNWRHLLIYDLSTEAEVRTLYDARNATLFGSDVYAYSEYDVFLVDGTAEEMSLTKVARTPIRSIFQMFVVSKTKDEFTFAIQTYRSSVFVISKSGNQPETATMLGKDGSGLVGSHEGHVFTTAPLNEHHIAREVLDFFDGAIVRRWKLSEEFAWCPLVWQMNCYYVEDEIGARDGRRYTVKALDLRTGRTAALWSSAGIPPYFVPALN